MSEIEYHNTRFDPSVTPFEELAKNLASAYGYTADLQLDKKLAQLVRLRVAQFNECSYCVILHADTAREIGIPAGKVDNISSYWQSDLYSEVEKTVLAYTDAVTIGSDPDFQTVHDAVAQFFSEVEIAELAAVVINMNLWTRLKLAQGQTPRYK